MNFASALATYDIIQRLPYEETVRLQFWYQFTGNLQLEHCSQILQEQWRAENSIKLILATSKQKGSH